MEIWSRVPYKMTVRCKSVSKRFSAFISRPEFMSRSISHYHTLLQHMNQEQHHKEWCLNFVSKRNLLIVFLPKLHLLNPQSQNQLSLSFLGRKFDPKLDDERKKSALYSRIVGYSNGLLLCKKTSRGRVYHVTNPMTREWTKLPLPPPPLTGHNQRDCVFEGFVCEPFYQVEANNVVTLNSHNRFRVVRFPWLNDRVFSHTPKFEFEMVVFSSETGQWCRKTVSCPKGFVQTDILIHAVAHRGRLYFMGRMDLLVYDPFNNDAHQCCHTIDYPIHSPYPRDLPFTGHVGVSCGNIRIANISCSFDPHVLNTMTVWELEYQDDSSCCCWHLVHKTFIPGQDRRSCIRPEFETRRECETVDLGMQVRAFHPHHGDVVFFQRAHSIFCGNLRTNQFDTVGYGIHGFQALQIISIDLPGWPAPVPSIT